MNKELLLMMTFAEIEALPSPTARMAAYQEYVEQAPHHPLAWFNLAVEAEAARAYDAARSAADTLRRRDAALFEMFPDRVRQLFQGERATATPNREIGGYRITGVASATESRILYDAVRVSDDALATLWRILDLSHASARTTFQLATDAPRVSGVAQPLGVVEDPEQGPLLAFERIRGESLRGDPRALLDVEVTLRLVRSAARAALALQRAGALHGDLRPEAVMRDQSRSEETLMIGGRRAGVSAPTPRGRLAWSSPEEVAGEVPTSATDVYSLGLLLHHLLTGTPPASLAERAPIRATSDWPELDELIAQLTSREPSLRPGLDGLIAQIDQLLARRDVPRMIGKWQIGRMLGEGSFGRVFSAENADISGLRAAVKVLHPFMARDRDMRRRFLNEASAASQIQHPSVVRVLDGGVEPGGVCYVAMELLQGRDLGERLARGPLALDVAVRLIREAAQALAVAHAQKIVHRDIKPSNLFIEEHSEGERLRILDFGIALLRGEPTREGIPYTATGHIWGTPEYMAPEQWRMVSDLDRRVDIYSLGLVLWECLAGRRPFTASTVFEWQQAHLTTPLPSTLRSTPGVPARLAALVDQMLAKRREERIATMEEVVAALDEISTPLPTHRIDASTLPPPTPPTPSADTPAPPTASTTLIATITADAAPKRSGNWTLIAGASGVASIGAILLYLNTRPPASESADDSNAEESTAPTSPDCSDLVFLEWGAGRSCGPEAVVWSYDPREGRCLNPLYDYVQLHDELQRLRSSNAGGFKELPPDFELQSIEDDERGKATFYHIPNINMFISYHPGGGIRDGGIRINDAPPAFLSRDGHWCDEHGRVLTSAAHKP